MNAKVMGFRVACRVLKLSVAAALRAGWTETDGETVLGPMPATTHLIDERERRVGGEQRLGVNSPLQLRREELHRNRYRFVIHLIGKAEDQKDAHAAVAVRLHDRCHRFWCRFR